MDEVPPLIDLRVLKDVSVCQVKPDSSDTSCVLLTLHVERIEDIESREEMTVGVRDGNAEGRRGRGKGEGREWRGKMTCCHHKEEGKGAFNGIPEGRPRTNGWTLQGRSF